MTENFLKSIEYLKNVQKIMKIDETTELKLKLRDMHLLFAENPNFFKISPWFHSGIRTFLFHVKTQAYNHLPTPNKKIFNLLKYEYSFNFF